MGVVMTMLSLGLFMAISTANDALAKYGCKGMDAKYFRDHIEEARSHFSQQKPNWSGKVDETPGIICRTDAHIYVDAKPEFNNVGFHWTIAIDRKTGKISIIEGI